jgi:hypothetical protein
MKTFLEMRTINVNDRVEKKEGLSYLTWSWAWDEFKQAYPTATYEVVKNADGLPYFESGAGAMCYTRVTVDGLTHEMWLPVMDSKNKAMKSVPYKYSTRQGEKTVEAFTMFDVNKTVMRCLVKNLAMFGLGLYIYAGEDLPSEAPPEPVDVKPHLDAIAAAANIDALKKAYIASVKACTGDASALKQLEAAKDRRKADLDKVDDPAVQPDTNKEQA